MAHLDDVRPIRLRGFGDTTPAAGGAGTLAAAAAGGGAGFLVGGPVGAAIGAGAGYFLGKGLVGGATGVVPTTAPAFQPVPSGIPTVAVGAPTVPAGTPDPDAGLSIAQIEAKYENQPMSNIPPISRGKLAADLTAKISAASSSSKPTEITWSPSDFGNVIFAGGTRPPWYFLIRTPAEVQTNLQQVLATFNNPGDLLRRMGIHIQHLGFFDSAFAKGLIAQIAGAGVSAASGGTVPPQVGTAAAQTAESGYGEYGPDDFGDDAAAPTAAAPTAATTPSKITPTTVAVVGVLAVGAWMFLKPRRVA